MEWVGLYFGVMLMAANNPKLLGASIVAAIGLQVVYPHVDKAFGIFLALGVCAVLATFRD